MKVLSLVALLHNVRFQNDEIKYFDEFSIAKNLMILYRLLVCRVLVQILIFIKRENMLNKEIEETFSKYFFESMDT